MLLIFSAVYRRVVIHWRAVILVLIIYDAAPLTSKQKFSLAARGTFDPVSMIGVGFAAGLEQVHNSYPGYGQGAAGYSKRFAAKFVDGRTSDFLTHAVFPSLFHQDPHYYYQGSGSFKSRFIHAVGSAFVTRSDSGFEPPTSWIPTRRSHRMHL
jgi:hypothetical protein